MRVVRAASLRSEDAYMAIPYGGTTLGNMLKSQGSLTPGGRTSSLLDGTFEAFFSCANHLWLILCADVSENQSSSFCKAQSKCFSTKSTNSSNKHFRGAATIMLSTCNKILPLPTIRSVGHDLHRKGIDARTLSRMSMPRIA